MNRPEICFRIPGSRADLRRRRVLEAARKLFIENGFHATGMAQIAKSSEIAIGQIYRDFASKDEIVAAMVQEDCSRLMMYEVLEQAIQDGDPESVKVWLREFVEPSDNPDDARLFAEILAESARSPRIASIFRQVHDELRGHMDEALEMLAPAPALASRRKVVAEVITTLSVGVTHQQLMRSTEDISGVISGVKAVLDRELAVLMSDSQTETEGCGCQLCR